MRMIVIADTHGYLDAARKAIVEDGPWDHVVHLGDSLLDAVDLSVELGIDIAGVRGNNEYPDSPDPGDKLVFEAGGVRFYAIHGHEKDLNHWDRGFEQGLAELAELARADEATVALFGHTHVPLIKEIGGVLIVNPGGMGLGDSKRTYASVTADGDGEVRVTIEEV